MPLAVQPLDLSTYLRFEFVVGTVTGLHQAGCPVAIRWRVVTIIVASFDCMLRRWRLAHVCQEVLKLIPTPTYLNPSATVIGIADVVRVVASVAHPNPTCVNLGTNEHGHGAI